MSRLATTYLGLELRSPVVASPSPFLRDLETAKRMCSAGAAAVVLPSLFEEEIIHEDLEFDAVLEAGAEGFAEALHYFPELGAVESIAERYLSSIRTAREQLGVPVIASLNAASPGGWVRYAELIQEAGADALELNLYHIAADPARTGSVMEELDLEVVRAVAESITIPLAVKLGPYYSAFANFATQTVEAGAAGLVLFNRFYQPDLDPYSREVVPSLELSRPWELRLPLRWIAILRPALGDRASLAATSGVHSGLDVAKALLVGADVAMMTSAVLEAGADHFAAVERDLVAWMDENEYEAVSEVRGSVSYAAADDPSAFERANYVKTLHSWSAPTRLTPGSPSA
jgi:dihydroorotate dehydrogenase (fumarate)